MVRLYFSIFDVSSQDQSVLLNHLLFQIILIGIDYVQTISMVLDQNQNLHDMCFGFWAYDRASFNCLTQKLPTLKVLNQQMGMIKVPIYLLAQMKSV